MSHATQLLQHELQQSVSIAALEASLLKGLEHCCNGRADTYIRNCTGCNSDEHALVPYDDIEGFQSVIAEGRRLARDIPWGYNAVTNRRNYVVGNGLTYKIHPIDDSTGAEDAIKRIDWFLDEWVERAKWGERQKRRMEMLDATGNAFLRYFPRANGYLDMRWVSPDELGRDPDDPGDDGRVSDRFREHGIRVSEDDIETIEAYYLTSEPNSEGKYGDWVNAAEIQHTKRRCPEDYPLGVPLLWSLRNYLDHAVQIEHGIAKLAEFHSTIAAIRTLKGAKTANAVFNWAKGVETDKGNTVEDSYDTAGPAVVTTTENVEWEFPEMGQTIPNLTVALESVIRTIAAGLLMPEYMLSSDARNNNRASSETAGEPSWKEFESVQDTFINEDMETVNYALLHAVSKKVETPFGPLTHEDIEAVIVMADASPVRVRNRRDEHTRYKDMYDRGGLTLETWQTKSGLNPKEEKQGTLVEQPQGATPPQPQNPPPAPAAPPA